MNESVTIFRCKNTYLKVSSYLDKFMAKYNSILDVVRNIPVVKLPKAEGGLSCYLWGKCEFLNPGRKPWIC